jgi:hypothetical protein
MGEFILTLLHAVTNTHILHFRASTQAEHDQLGEFYPALSDLVDSLTEAMQGRTGEKIEYPVQYYPPAATGLEELTMLRDYVDEERENPDIPQNSEIQNIIDEISAQIDSTINKLKNYK